jgi:hypothetical protein
MQTGRTPKRATKPWSAPTTPQEVYRRAGGRRRYNATRQLRAALRRRAVLKLLGEFGLGYGTQQRIAARLGVSAATISRDFAWILPLVQECPRCGTLTAREPW